MKTHCKRGHDLTDPQNVYIRPGTNIRQCRSCHRERVSRLRRANPEPYREANRRYFRSLAKGANP